MQTIMRCAMPALLLAVTLGCSRDSAGPGNRPADKSTTNSATPNLAADDMVTLKVQGMV